MKNIFTFAIIAFTTFASTTEALELQKPIPPVTLEGQTGGRLDKTGWSSEELKGKVGVVFYVDPDHKNRNNDFSEALKEKKYSLEKYQSVAIINLKATWMPNFAIRSALKKKQLKYPNTTYLEDKKKHIVKMWDVKNGDSDIIITDKNGIVVYFYYGKMDATEIEKALAIMEKAMQ